MVCFFIFISSFAGALTLLRIWRFPPPVLFPTQLRHRISAINAQVQSQSAAEKEKSRQDFYPAGFQRVKKVCDFFARFKYATFFVKLTLHEKSRCARQKVRTGHF
jgi:hypothetical protein